MSLTVIKAVAGSGKTHQIISELDTETKTLIVTYTEANRDQIINRTINRLGFLPKNITILTWLEFLFRDIARPYSNEFSTGMLLSGIDIYTEKKYRKLKMGVNQELPEYYLNSKNQIYSFQLPMFCTKMISRSNSVLDRISGLYSKIYIDEAQDLCGYDYEIVKAISDKIETKIVGDTLQKTYSTHQTNKYSNYNTIFDFLDSERIAYTPICLNETRRFGKNICNFINEIFCDTNIESSIDDSDDEFVTIVDDSNLEDFINKYNPIALTHDKKRECHTKERVNIGESKGLEYDAIIVYGTPDMTLVCQKTKSICNLKPRTKNKLYVALTRARKVVGIYVKNEKIELKSDPLF